MEHVKESSLGRGVCTLPARPTQKLSTIPCFCQTEHKYVPLVLAGTMTRKLRLSLGPLRCYNCLMNHSFDRTRPSPSSTPLHSTTRFAHRIVHNPSLLCQAKKCEKRDILGHFGTFCYLPLATYLLPTAH
jgi:hypothetical protein